MFLDSQEIRQVLCNTEARYRVRRSCRSVAILKHNYSVHVIACCVSKSSFNPLAPNDVYRSRTAQLTSRRCILNIYSTNILTEYFEHAEHSPFFFPFQDAVYFIMLSLLVPVIFTI